MTKVRIIVCVLLAAFAPAPAWAQQSSLLGTVASRESVTFRPTAVVEITLEDMSQADAPVVIATTKIRRPEPLPFTFTLGYDASAIRSSGRYAVRVRIIDGTAVLLEADPTPVLTQGRGSVASVSLSRPSPKPAPVPSPSIETSVPKPAASENVAPPVVPKAEAVKPPVPTVAKPAEAATSKPTSSQPSSKFDAVRQAAAPEITKPEVTKPAPVKPESTAAPVAAKPDTTQAAATTPPVPAVSKPAPPVTPKTEPSSAPAKSEPVPAKPASAQPPPAPAPTPAPAPAAVKIDPPASKPAPKSEPVKPAAETAKPKTTVAPPPAPAPAPAPTVTPTAAKVLPPAPVPPTTPKPTPTPTATPARTKAVAPAPVAPPPVAVTAPAPRVVERPAALRAAGVVAPIASLPATFAGTLPCADCQGIRYHLNLFADGAYILRRTRLGKTDAPSDEAGSFGYSSDGAVLILKSSDQASFYFSARIADTLRAVDGLGESLGLARPQDLQRAASFDPLAMPVSRYLAAFVSLPLSGPSWRLVTMEGKDVKPSGRNWRDTRFAFDATTGTFNGISGCNEFSGQYAADLKSLTIKPLKPLRACLAHKAEERALGRAIANARTYRITGTALDLFDANGARLARFEGQLPSNVALSARPPVSR